MYRKKGEDGKDEGIENDGFVIIELEGRDIEMDEVDLEESFINPSFIDDDEGFVHIEL